MQENVYTTVDLREYGRMLLKRIWIVVLAVVVLVVVVSIFMAIMEINSIE